MKRLQTFSLKTFLQILIAFVLTQISTASTFTVCDEGCDFQTIQAADAAAV